MKQLNTKLPEKKLIGLQVRTNNQTEIDKMAGKIFPLVQAYFQEMRFEQIPNRTQPGTTFCCYTDYESDQDGDYTYFIGEEVESLDAIPEGFEALTIPAQDYAKFTTEPAPMPDVVRDAWFSIWKMTDKDFGGKRRYATDFEIYDERASDHQNIVMDLYIGLEESA